MEEGCKELISRIQYFYDFLYQQQSLYKNLVVSEENLEIKEEIEICLEEYSDLTGIYKLTFKDFIYTGDDY